MIMNKNIISKIFVALFILIAPQTSWAQDSKGKKNAFPDMTVEEVQAAIKNGKITIIDVNSLASYRAGHLPGALHFAALKKDGMSDALPEDKASLIVAYCGSPR